jgi:hypothetical protein
LQILKEITVWDKVDYTVPNHTYAVNDAGKCVAYKKAGSDHVHVFSKPRMFSKSYRKFVKQKPERLSVPWEKILDDAYAQRTAV